MTTVRTIAAGQGHSPQEGAPSDEAFDAVYASCSARVRGLVRRLVADAELVEDIVQEAFLRAYTSRIHCDGDDPWPWLAAVARNLSLDALRRVGRSIEHHLDEGDLVEVTADGPTPEAEAERVVELVWIHEALSSLSARQRRILVLKHIQGWRYRDIAAAERLSDDALKSILVRARRNFRRQYVARSRDVARHG